MAALSGNVCLLFTGDAVGSFESIEDGSGEGVGGEQSAWFCERGHGGNGDFDDSAGADYWWVLV